MNINQQLLALLTQLETQLKHHQLWSAQIPSPQQLNSQTPFAADVMPFENWLQFIFIERFKQLLLNNQPLPTNMSITPMAEISFGQQYADLIKTISEIDNLVLEQNK